MPNFNDSMKAKVAPAAINTGLARPAGTGSTNDLLYTLWGGTAQSINDRGNAYFNASSGPAFRSISQGQGTVGTWTIPVPTGTASGDQLLMFTQVQYDYKGYTLGSPGGLWTQIAFNDSFVFFYQSNAFIVHKRTATASESTFTWSGGANHYAGMSFVVAVSGATAVDVVGAFPTSRTAPSVTTTTSTDLLLYAVASADAYSIVGPTGMVQRANAAPTPAVFQTSISTETLTATGATGTRTVTTSPVVGDVGFASLLIAVK